MANRGSGISGSCREHSGGTAARRRVVHVFLVLVIAGLVLPAGADAWMFRANPQHTGEYSDGGIRPNNVMNWNVSIGTELIGSPAVADGVVYIGSNNGKIYALDAATGAEKWNATIGTGYLMSSPAVTNGSVFIGSDDSRVYALNATTGETVWDFLTGGEVQTSPAVLNTIVYVGSDDTSLYALDALTGAKIWNTTAGAGIRSPAVGGGVIAFLRAGQISALDAATGAFLWNVSTGYWESSSPAIVNGIVYAGSDNGKFSALESMTGEEIWQFSPGAAFSFSCPAVVGNYVYVAGGNASTGRVFALNRVTGEERWNITVSDHWITSSASVANGTVYVGDGDNRLLALNAITGAPRWNFTTGDWISSSPAVAHGIVYVTSRDGRIFAIGRQRAPAVTAIEPASVIQGTTVQVSNLSGAGFLAGARVNLTKTGSGPLNATNITVVSRNRITCTFRIPAGAAIGPWSVVVKNADGQSGTRANGFLVKTKIPPLVTAIVPGSGRRGRTVQVSNLSGAVFMAGAKVTLTRTGSGPLNATNITVVSRKKITCTFRIPVSAATGPWNVVVKNADGQSGSRAGAFLVRTP